jgi:glucoamylase
VTHDDAVAFGALGIEPRWTSSAKDGVGTAYHNSSRVWFTPSRGIIHEIYFPFVDTPNTRDLQFLITDGETFCQEENALPRFASAKASRRHAAGT